MRSPQYRPFSYYGTIFFSFHAFNALFGAACAVTPKRAESPMDAHPTLARLDGVDRLYRPRSLH
ncbi:MAG TPA: hypothetical protein VE779_02965, partial [Candidatus Angelobacter sp.]|nr:hypothetical protein [Candidatus Angelobacter sp.]